MLAYNRPSLADIPTAAINFGGQVYVINGFDVKQFVYTWSAGYAENNDIWYCDEGVWTKFEQTSGTIDVGGHDFISCGTHAGSSYAFSGYFILK